MLKKGHEFNQKSKRQKVKRKQRRKESEFDRAAVKKRKGIVVAPKEVAPKRAKVKQQKKPKKLKEPDNRTELTDENLTDVMGRYRKD